MPELISLKNIESAVVRLTEGGMVAFPTETVYGLGGNAYSDDVVANIFAIKNRPTANPVSVCYASLEASTSDVVITDTAWEIAEKFLPGPITLVLKRTEKSKISRLCSAGADTIGIRVPANAVALDLLQRLPFPLAAPSANRSGQLSHTTPQEVANDLFGIDIIDGGRCERGIESTIVDCSGPQLRILRQGAITMEEIALQCAIPFEKLIIAEKTKQFLLGKRVILNAETITANDALLAFGPQLSNECKYTLNLSESGDINEAARNFFSMLFRLAQKEDVQTIRVMPIPQEGIGKAINARLKSLLR